MEPRKRSQDLLQEDNEITKRRATNATASTSGTLVPRSVTSLVPRQTLGRKKNVAVDRKNRKVPAAFQVLPSIKTVNLHGDNDRAGSAEQQAAPQSCSTTHGGKLSTNDNQGGWPQSAPNRKRHQQQWSDSDHVEKQHKPHLDQSLPPADDDSQHLSLSSNILNVPVHQLKDYVPRPKHHTVTRVKKNNQKEVGYPYGNYPRYYEGRVRGVMGAASKSKQQAKVRCPTDLLLFQKESPTTSAPSLPSPSALMSSSSTTAPAQTARERYRDHAKMVDGRLEFLEPQWFRFKRVLDIGCNSGLLTLFIGLHYQPVRIQGVDIDSALIQQATKFTLKTYSKLAPQAYPSPRTWSGERALSYTDYLKHSIPLTPPNNSTSAAEDGSEATRESKDTGDLLSNLNTFPYYEDYFPKSMGVMHGYLPIPAKTDESKYVFPHNMEFRVTDWAAEDEESEDNEGNEDAEDGLWDVILGFSLTKWIHLHHGDEGIKRFFHKVYRSLAPGGIFLLEPQKFSTYNKRAKLIPEMYTTYSSIRFKPDQFEQFLLEEVGFRRAVHLGRLESKAKNLNRPIVMYCK
ncbi:hypothetical protein DFQ27_006822 [Actinomortierella ambigua]|uniref:RNA methyltransferase n=1 Tax=Actinomortierella ambigua TaxID=1343610 RepID=A0A9P6PWK2_9FUNG|nr:hypothetical protein DFQ27_006822 [Actinomortierella ambigua]